MLRATLKSLLARKLRLVLSALSIVLGVSFVAGALILTDSQKRGFDQLFATVNAGVAVDVRGTETLGGDSGARLPVPPAVLDTVRGVPGVVEAEPNINGTAVLIGRDGKARGSNGPPNIGTNYVDSPRLSLSHLVAGRAPAGPTEMVLNRALADDTGYGVGDTAAVDTRAGERRFTVVGILAYSGDRSSIAGVTVVTFDLPTARALLTDGRGYDEVLVAAADGTDAGQLRDRVRAALPAGLEAITGTQLADEQASDVGEALNFFSTFLLVFAAVALFVGAFIIVNTFTILIAQRTRELALMRALGASRWQVTRAVLVEATLVGVLASTIGLGLGVLTALGIKALFNGIGFGLPDAPTVIAARTVIAAFAVGVGVTVVAALLPARRAAAVPPLAAMREAATPDRPLRRQVVVGSVLLAGGAAAMAVGLTGHGMLVLGLGTLVTFVGVALLSPVISRPVVRVLGAPFTRGLPGRLGRENSRRNPRRTASTAAALMVGIALVSAVSVLGASLKQTIVEVTDRAMGADFLVSGEHVGVDPAAVERIRAVPGVGEVSGMRQGGVRIAGKNEFVLAVPPAALGHTVSVTAASGDLADFGPGRLLVSAKAATDQGLRSGQQVDVAFADGASQRLMVAATYEDNQLLGNYVLSDDAGGHFRRQAYDFVLVGNAAGADPAAVRTGLHDAVAPYSALLVQDRSEFVAEQGRQVDQLLLVVNALLALSVLIAVLGIVNTLALSVLERTRELGLLRAVGMARRQVKRMVRVESVVIALFGGLLGLAVGTAFGVALQRALVDQGVTVLAVPGTQLVLFLLLSGLAGGIAAWLPARRASRLNVLAAIATD
jgi:putative ABC transport system permease protein